MESFIDIRWTIEDVQSVRPDLTNEQAGDVLCYLKRKHDASIGINWDVIKIWCDELYPKEGV